MIVWYYDSCVNAEQTIEICGENLRNNLGP